MAKVTASGEKIIVIFESKDANSSPLLDKSPLRKLKTAAKIKLNFSEEKVWPQLAKKFPDLLESVQAYYFATKYGKHIFTSEDARTFQDLIDAKIFHIHIGK